MKHAHLLREVANIITEKNLHKVFSSVLANEVIEGIWLAATQGQFEKTFFFGNALEITEKEEEIIYSIRDVLMVFGYTTTSQITCLGFVELKVSWKEEKRHPSCEQQELGKKYGIRPAKELKITAEFISDRLNPLTETINRAAYDKALNGERCHTHIHQSGDKRLAKALAEYYRNEGFTHYSVSMTPAGILITLQW